MMTFIAMVELAFNLLISLPAHGSKVLDKGLLEVAALIRGIVLLILDMLDESLTDQRHVVRYFLGGPLVAVPSIGVGSPAGRIAAPLGVRKV